MSSTQCIEKCWDLHYFINACFFFLCNPLFAKCIKIWQASLLLLQIECNHKPSYKVQLIFDIQIFEVILCAPSIQKRAYPLFTNHIANE